jgi:[acyl-carrier-protein] S-malonyltransferase
MGSGCFKENMKYNKIAFLFPGQGAQYPGMGKDFAESYAVARETFEEADDLLRRKISLIAWQGPETRLTETRNSQTAIFVTSVALLRVLKKLFPFLEPAVCAGLSLGEYTALVAAGKLSFGECLEVVEKRGQYMNEACEATPGTMAVVMGLDGSVVEALLADLHLPKEIWAANFNCPGQVVISGTLHGVALAGEKAKEKGAKRVLPLQVHGAFHSGLMQSAEDRLKREIEQIAFKESPIDIVMNFSGAYVSSSDEMRRQLIKQVTSPVQWERGVRAISSQGVDLFLEIGCGKTLTGMNKRIGVTVPTLSVEKVQELDMIAKEIL